MTKYLELAKEFCANNDLSSAKLNTQVSRLINTSFIIAQPMPSTGLGLAGDLASQPKPTLIYHIDTGEFETTEYTKKYLSND